MKGSIIVIMLLVSHIIIALTSLIYTGRTFLKPSRIGLKVSYTLVAATLVSGTYLVLSTHAPLTSACLTGLIYLGVISTGLAAAHLKLSLQKA